MNELPSSRALPRGFRFASAACGLKKRGHTGTLDVAMIVSDVPASAAAVFTQNLVQAPPVVLSRAHVKESASEMRALVKRPLNCIPLDGDSSTNDTLLVLVNGGSGVKKITKARRADYTKFVAA